MTTSGTPALFIQWDNEPPPPETVVTSNCYEVEVDQEIPASFFEAMEDWKAGRVEDMFPSRWERFKAWLVSL